MARVHVDCDFFTGNTLAVMIDNPACDFILGKIPGANFKCVKVTNAVQTKGQKARAEHPFRPVLTAKVPQLDIDRDKLVQLQEDDQTLTSVFHHMGKLEWTDTGGNVVSFVLKDSLLFCRCCSVKLRAITWQVVVPTAFRESICIAAHDSLFGGHLAGNSSFNRISPFFFWPGYPARM